MAYVETAADYAFGAFLAGVSPESFSRSEWDLYRFLRLRVTK